MSGPDPLSRQRSPWERTPEHDTVVPDNVGVFSHRRRVHDGVLIALVSYEPLGWHLSISHRRPTVKGPKHVRYPNWDEITHARYELLPGKITMAMILPPVEQYVACHPTTFHLHEVSDQARRLIGGDV